MRFFQRKANVIADPDCFTDIEPGKAIKPLAQCLKSRFVFRSSQVGAANFNRFARGEAGFVGESIAGESFEVKEIHAFGIVRGFLRKNLEPYKRFRALAMARTLR